MGGGTAAEGHQRTAASRGRPAGEPDRRAIERSEEFQERVRRRRAFSEPLTRLAGADDATELRLRSGHVGLVAGRSAAKVARSQIAEWIRAQSDQGVAAAAA